MNHAPQAVQRLHHQNLIHIISTELPSLNKTQSKVAKAILADPNAATYSSIAALAKKSAVSEPSVNRFCKHFNATGFPDLKLKLARSLAVGSYIDNRIIDPKDDVQCYTSKIIDSAISELALVRDNICHQQITQIVESLLQAKRIYFFGIGSSAAVAKDAENKFFRFNLPVSSQDNILKQRILASTGSVGDLFFIISQSGQAKELIEIARLAKANDSIVITLTSSESPLAQYCSQALYVDTTKNFDKYKPIPSRIAHLVILDVLSAGVALHDGADFLPNLEK